MDNITATAQALSGLGTVSGPGLLGLILSMLLAVAMSPAAQALVEGLIASVLPAWAFFAKPFIPSAVAGLVGSFANAKGLPAMDAVAGAAALASMMHWVNEQPWAVSLEGKPGFKSVWAFLSSVVGKTPPAAILVLGLLALGAGALHADDVTPTAAATPVAGWCAGPALWAGSSLYQTDGGGTLVPAQEALGGVEFAGYLGSWTGAAFAPTYTLGVIGAMSTQGSTNRPAVGVTGGFYLNGVPLTVFAAKELTADAGGLLWGVGTSVQFSGWVPFLYLGHPGN